MSTGPELDATWAISSKVPGRSQGHQITCAPGDDTTAGRLFALAESMGTPEGRHVGRPDELPWFTFTGGGSSDEPIVALTSIEWSNERDGTQQPITPARAVWLSWAVIADRGLDYFSLWCGAAKLRWPEVDHGPEGATGHRVAVTAPRPDGIVHHDFGFVAQIAAHLVDGSRVAIVLDRTDSVTTAERLRLLDAVLALLPFGARNCLTVATWASYKSRQDAVLTFSDGIQPDQISVSWHHRHLLHSPGPRGQDYLRELRTITAEGYEVVKIVDHLAARTEPLRHIGELVLDTLKDIRFASVVHEEVERGAGDVDRVRRALREPNVTEKHVKTFVRFLATSACSADREEAKQAGEVIVAGWRREFPELLGELCRSESHRVMDQEVKWLKLSLAADKNHAGASFTYLAHALWQPVVPREDHYSQALVNLTVHYLSGKTIETKDCEVLVARPHVLLRSLSAILRPDAKGPMWLKALIARSKTGMNQSINELMRYSTARGPAWLKTVLLTAKGQAADLDPRDVEALADLGHWAVACFVDLLIAKAGLHKCVDISWPALMRLLNTNDSEKARGVIRTLLSATALKRDEQSAAHRARADVLSLLCDLPPKYQDLVESASDEYLDAFRLALSALDHDPVARVTGNLLEHLRNSLGSARPAVVQSLDNALKIGIKRQYLDMMAQWLQHGRLRDVRELDLPPVWQDDLKARPELAWYRSLDELNSLVTTGTTVAEVLRTADEALRNTSAVDEVVRSLHTYASKTDADAVDELLRRLRHQDATGEHVASKVRDRIFNGDRNSAPTKNFIRHVDEELAWYTWLSPSETKGHR